MQFYSLNKQSTTVDFKTATILGQAPDKGLYFPEVIPQVSKKLIDNIENFSNEAIALQVITPYIGESIPKKELDRIINETVNFEFPIIKISESIYSLELFHGPTLAFKDVGARFMSLCLGYFAKGNNKKVTVLVATSGDTGGAVAQGFYDVEGVDVVILYPSGKVSNVQEKQLTTLGKNIYALEVDGTFDECQQMVKAAFADNMLNKKLKLTSANSINVARWLPQQFYYFYLWKQWKDKNNPPVVAVPSGNFGNICAGLLARQSGLPIKHFIAACNTNDTVPQFLNTGNYHPKKAIATLSNAMDVGDPSNFIRVLQLFERQNELLKKLMSGYSVSDEETKTTLVSVLKDHNYLLDPHGAVAYKALYDHLAIFPADKGVILETAHPIKFYDKIEPLIEQPVEVPEKIAMMMNKEKFSTKISADTSSLIDFLMAK
ncbi:MAG: threonine synthase [Ferruginibacter sp.]|nr:threonine synthase [Bacteroidota bacterium]MBX2920387.1 threonine synthase [Ferruginibacter sp.]MCC7379202.1 threonine synthase [Chitinophagaceae bacterium]